MCDFLLCIFAWIGFLSCCAYLNVAVLSGTLDHFRMPKKKHGAPVESRRRPTRHTFSITLGKGVVPCGMFVGNRNTLKELCGLNPPPPSVCMCISDAARNEINRVINSEEFSKKIDKEFPSLRMGYTKLVRFRDGRGRGLIADKDVPYDEKNKTGVILSLYIGCIYEEDGDREFHAKLKSDRACGTDGGVKRSTVKGNIEVGFLTDKIASTHSKLLEYTYNMVIYGHSEPFGFDPDVTPGKLRALGVDEETIDGLSRKMLPHAALAGGFVNHACGWPNCTFQYVYVQIGKYLIHFIAIVNSRALKRGMELTLGYGDNLSDESNFHTLPERVGDEIVKHSTGINDNNRILKKNGVSGFVDGYRSGRLKHGKIFKDCLCGRCVCLRGSRAELSTSKFIVCPDELITGNNFQFLGEGVFKAFTLENDEITLVPGSESSDDENTDSFVSSVSSEDLFGTSAKKTHTAFVDPCAPLIVGAASEEIGSVHSRFDAGCVEDEPAFEESPSYELASEDGGVAATEDVLDAEYSPECNFAGDVDKERGVMEDCAAVGALEESVRGRVIRLKESKTVAEYKGSYRQVLQAEKCEEFRYQRNLYLKREKREAKRVGTLSAADVISAKGNYPTQTRQAHHDGKQCTQVSSTRLVQECLLYDVAPSLLSYAGKSQPFSLTKLADSDPFPDTILGSILPPYSNPSEDPLLDVSDDMSVASKHSPVLIQDATNWNQSTLADMSFNGSPVRPFAYQRMNMSPPDTSKTLFGSMSPEDLEFQRQWFPPLSPYP